MAKTIILTEQQNKLLIKQTILESIGNVIIGRDTYNLADINKLSTISNNTFTLLTPENDYSNWEAVGFDKDTKEYAKWCSDVEYFMKAIMGGMMISINNKKQRKGVTFNYLILDPQWMRLAIQGRDKLNDIGANEGNNTGFRCLYTFIITIFQNKCMWNDFFFNPVFKELPNFMSQLTREAIQMGQEYKQIMPLTMIKEMNLFKADKNNAKPELFYDPDWRNKGYTKAERERQTKDLETNPILSLDDMD